MTTLTLEFLPVLESPPPMHDAGECMESGPLLLKWFENGRAQFLVGTLRRERDAADDADPDAIPMWWAALPEEVQSGCDLKSTVPSVCVSAVASATQEEPN